MKGDLLVQTPDEKYKSFLDKISLKIRQCSRETDLVFTLNPIIRGFANFYRPGNWRRVKAKTNNLIYHKIIKWIMRHKQVSKKDAHKKYCTDYHTFTFPVHKTIDDSGKLELFLPSKFPKGN